MKVLLVSTPCEYNPVFPHAAEDDSVYPLGLIYLKSYLELKGHTVELAWLDHLTETWEPALITRMEQFRPDVVGFTILTVNRVTTYHGIELIHEKHPETRIVLGGIHATIMYHQLLNKYPYVVIVRGEGELTFEELLIQPDLTKIKGIVYADRGYILKNLDRELIPDLDTLPFPDHKEFFKGNRTSANILTSRGCPGNCSFCCLNPVSKKRVRQRSVENVIKEIDYLTTAFPKLETIWIEDDTFFLNNKRVIDFCDEVIKHKYKVSFCCAGRIKPLTEEMVIKLELAGFKEVMLGLESGDNDVLKRCHKGITQDDTLAAITLFSKKNINLTLYIIVGLPGETRQTILTTARFIQRLQRIKYIHFWTVGILLVFPGTEVYKLSKQSGVLDDTYWLTSETTPYYTVENARDITNSYSDLLLSYIKMEKIVTLSGFLHQFFMIPWIFAYLWRYNPRTRRLR